MSKRKTFDETVPVHVGPTRTAFYIACDSDDCIARCWGVTATNAAEYAVLLGWDVVNHVVTCPACRKRRLAAEVVQS
jgi:hypothetical protein